MHQSAGLALGRVDKQFAEVESRRLSEPWNRKHPIDYK